MCCPAQATAAARLAASAGNHSEQASLGEVVGPATAERACHRRHQDSAGQYAGVSHVRQTLLLGACVRTLVKNTEQLLCFLSVRHDCRLRLSVR